MYVLLYFLASCNTQINKQQTEYTDENRHNTTKLNYVQITAASRNKIRSGSWKCELTFDNDPTTS